jgi:hypothetical protein
MANHIRHGKDKRGDELPEELGHRETRLKKIPPCKFHEELQRLGDAVGAQTTRLTTGGVPDVIWSFDNNVHFVFEAKTDKKLISIL